MLFNTYSLSDVSRKIFQLRPQYIYSLNVGRPLCSSSGHSSTLIDNPRRLLNLQWVLFNCLFRSAVSLRVDYRRNSLQSSSDLLLLWYPIFVSVIDGTVFDFKSLRYSPCHRADGASSNPPSVRSRRKTNRITRQCRL